MYIRSHGETLGHFWVARRGLYEYYEWEEPLVLLGMEMILYNRQEQKLSVEAWPSSTNIDTSYYHCRSLLLPHVLFFTLRKMDRLSPLDYSTVLARDCRRPFLASSHHAAIREQKN